MSEEETEITVEEPVEDYFEEPRRTADVTPEDMEAMVEIIEKINLALEDKIPVKELENLYKKPSIKQTEERKKKIAEKTGRKTKKTKKKKQ